MYRAKALVASALPLASQCVEGRVLSLSKLATRPAAMCLARVMSIQAQESFLNGSSSTYIEEMYNRWTEDPKSVHAVSFVIYIHYLFALIPLFRVKQHHMISFSFDTVLVDSP